MEKHSKLTAKKVIIILGVVFAVCIAALAAFALNRGNVVPATEEYGYVNPDETKASPDEGFVIDGVLDETQYEKCNWLKLKNDEGGAGVDIAMTSFYGEKGMYIVYDITESSPIYVNLQRSSYMNSGIEMYLALDGVTSMATNKAFEIDLLPTGDMSFKQRTGRENWVNVASSEEIMAYLGATTKGGAINTEECNGYNLELFIPWDYMDKLGMNADEMKKTFVYINPVHITSYNYEGTNASTDRYWYAFATQLGSDGWNDVAQYFRFGANGVLGTVPVKLVGGDNYTISGNDSVIPGMKTSITIKPEDGYVLNSILVNGEEYIKKVAYNEDGSVTLKIRGVKEGLTVSASAEKITEGNKTLSGVVAVHKLGGDTLEGVSISYKGPGGEKPIEFDNNGKFELKDLKQGYYIVTAEKKGYAPINRGICVNRDMDIELTLEYQMFEAESGYNWILDNQNDGILNRFGGSGKILSVDSYNKFKVDANFKYDKELAAKSDGDTFLQQRSGIQMKFSNGKYWRVNLMNEKGVFKVQYAKHNTDTVFDWKTVHELTAEEIAQYQSEDGIKLSVLRDGKYAWVCLNDKPVAIEVLDDEYAKCTAQIGFEGWIANQEIEEMEYNISTNFKNDLKNFYFATSSKWNISRQLDGVVSLPGGGTDALKFYKQYTDIDLTIKNVKEHDTTGKKPGRTDVLFEFDTNGDGKIDKSVSFGITCVDGKECWVQTLGNADNYIPATRIKGLYKLDAKQAEDYLKGDGVDFRVVRKGTDVYLFIDGEEVCIWDLTQNNSGVTADMKATVSIRHYDAKADTVEIPFTVTDKVENVEIKKIFKDNENWDLTKQLEGIVSLSGGGTDTSLQFFKKYANIDVTVIAKENDSTGKAPGRTDILFEFDLNNDGTMDKNVSFGIVQLANGSCKVQTLGWDKKFIPTKRINDLYELNYAEAKAYKNEGVELRVVRYGTEAYVYVGDNQVAVFDLTQNESGVKSDTKATVSLRHYDAIASNVVIPFKVTDQVEKPKVEEAKEKIFKDNFKWELSKQLEGIVSLPEGGDGGKLEFISSYKDIDLTLTARDYDDAGKTAARTDVLFVFENGAHVSFGITSDDTRAWIQSLNNGADDDKQIYNRWAGHGNLTSEELENYKADGVEFRIVRVGTDVLLYIDGRQVKIADLTNNNRGVTADMEANVFIRHYDDKGEYVEIPFSVKAETDVVAITDNSTTGKIVTDKKSYVIGDTVVLSGQFEGYYVSELKVNGKAVTLNSDGTYTFKATENNYSVEGTFKKAIFKQNSAWNLLNQNQGTVEVNFVEATQGVVTLPNGGNAYNDNNLGGLEFKDKYTNMDLNLVVRDYNDSANTYARTDVLFEFDGGETASFGVTKTGAKGDEANWTYRVQSAGSTLLGWSTLRDMTEDEIALYTGESGIDFRILRNGTSFYVYLGGKLAKSYDFKDKISANTEATVTLRHYDDAGVQVDIPFTVADEVKSIFTTTDASGGAWNIANQFGGNISVNATGNATIPFADKYTDIDLTVTAKENAAVGAARGRTDVLFEFDTNDDGTIDKNISFGVLCTNATNGDYYVQSLNSANDTVNAGKYIIERGKGFYKLDADEIEKYNGNGIDFRIVRSGTVVYLFLDGRQVAICDLTSNNSGVTANTKATVKLRHYDVKGNINFPFTVSNKVQETTVDIASSGNGTIAKNKVYLNANRNNPLDITKHFVGEKVILTATPASKELGCTQLLVNDKDVTADMVVNADGTATYALKATEKNYNAEATFGNPLIFADDYNKSLWDASTQFDGYVSLPNGGGATANPLRFNKKYVDMDLSLVVRDYPYAGTEAEDARTDVEYVFDNGESVTFSVVKTSGKYRIQTRGGTLLNWKTPYFIEDQDLIDSYVITQEELDQDQSQENLGGLPFRIVRKGTEFYLYLEDDMVKGYDFSYEIAADTPATVYLRHYDDKGGKVVIPFTVTDEVTIENPRLYTDKSAVTDYAYSFAVLPDIQIVTENDAVKGESNLAKLFDWIVANKDSKKIQYVFGLGDITENNNATEWTLAQTQHAKLTTAGIPYSAIRGNHDLPWYRKDENAENYNTDDYTAYMGTADYRAQFATGGFYSEDNISNSWRTFEVGDVKYLMLTLDYGPSDAVLNWASDIIYQHPERNVIITTHAYLYRDGTTLDANESVPPSASGGVNNGDHIWEKLVSKHENIVLVMSGHDPSENIVVNRSTGDNGNVVTSMLIDAQDVESDEGSMGMVAMLYFSEDGKNIQVEYYSTAKEKYFKSENQFNIELDVVEDNDVVYGQGYVPVKGQQVKAETAFASFPRTVEVTFNRNSKATRQVLLGNCGGSSNDYFNLEAPINENIIYLNLCLGGTTFQHSFNTVSVPTNETFRVTVVIEDAAVKCYVNGVLAQTRTATNGGNGSKPMSDLWASVPNANLSNLYVIGSDLRTGNSYYGLNGTIYDVALWSDARTPEEIATSSIATIDTNDENLIAAYNFRAGYSEGETAPFSTGLSGNGYNLTGTLNVAMADKAPIGAYTKASVSAGSGYSTTVQNEQRITLAQNPYTVSAWIYLPTSVSDAAGVIIGNYSGSYANCMNFEISTNGNPRFYHRNASNVYDSLILTSADVRNDKAWTHVAYTISGNKVSFYVNGELKGTLSATNTIQLESINKIT